MAIQRIEGSRPGSGGSRTRLDVMSPHPATDSVIEGGSGGETAAGANHCLPCGACAYCGDTCGDSSCDTCACHHEEPPLSLSSSLPSTASTSAYNMAHTTNNNYITNTTKKNCYQPAYFTMCEVRRHNTPESAWIVAGNDVYDVTEYMDSHPGGSTSILKKSGGVVDCTQDLHFHSLKGQKLWKLYHLGKITQCPLEKKKRATEKEWWRFWE